MSSCLRMPVAPGTSSCFAIFVSAPTLMSFSVARSMRSIFSGGGGPVGFRGGLKLLRLRPGRQAVYQIPQCVQSFARGCRDRQHRGVKHGFKLPHRADPFAVREFVEFGRDDRGACRRRPDPLPRRQIAFESGVPRVHQQQGCRVPRECRLRHLVERLGSSTLACPASLLAPGVSEARQIHQMQRRSVAAGDPVHIGEPSLAGLSACARQFLPDERVDQARLADIRTPHQDDFRQITLRKALRGGGTGDEFSGNLQWVMVSSMTAPSTGSACTSGAMRPTSGSTSAVFRTSSIVWTM